MEDQQNQHNQQNKNLHQLNPYELLDDFGKQIVDLRLEGWKYKRLETVAKKEEQTIRTWFMQGGIYHNACMYRRDQILKEALEDFSEAEFHLKQGVADAIVIIKAEIARKNWRAAVVLLKMVGSNMQKVINEEEDEEVQFLQNLIKDYERLSKERNIHTTNS